MDPSMNYTSIKYISQLCKQRAALKATLRIYTQKLESFKCDDYCIAKIKMNLGEIDEHIAAIEAIIDDCNRWVDHSSEGICKLSDQVTDDGADVTYLKKRNNIKDTVKNSEAPNIRLESIESENSSFHSDIISEDGDNRKHIGRPNNFPTETKMKVIQMCKNMTVKEASAETGIRVSTIYNWLKARPKKNKSDRCRTRDFDMEDKLIAWIQNHKTKYGCLPNCQDIRDKALEYSTCHNFKASLTWYHKFMNRSNLIEEALED